MINLLIFSIIAGVVSSVILVPFMTNREMADTKMPSNRWSVMIGTAIFSAVIIFVFYYLTNMDRNWTSLWVLLLAVTILGALLAWGKERKVKIVLFLAALVFGAYLLSAPLFNANQKYKAVEMDQQVEIKAFDETKTPASVPPKFARNKMKKAFGQVPNTSYYELGNLQIQKVDGEFVYIAPVEFSGLLQMVERENNARLFHDECDRFSGQSEIRQN